MKIAELRKVKAKTLKLNDRIFLIDVDEYRIRSVSKVTQAREKHVAGEKQTPGMLMTIAVQMRQDEKRAKRFRVLPSADVFIEPRK